MLRIRLRQFFVLMLCCSMVFTPVFAADQLALPPTDINSPEIIHKPVIETLKAGHLKPITATVTDNVGLKSVTLYYRSIGSERYHPISMYRIGDSNQFSVTLDEQYYKAPGIEYYIQATDTVENSLLHGYAFSPMTLVIQDVGTSTPGTEFGANSANDAAAVDLGDTIGEKGSRYKWLWIGLGVLAVGALASGSGGGDNPPPSSSSLDLTVPTPESNGN